MTAVTLCITMGRRPELLRQTLTSLLMQANFDHIIAINDFRDEATNAIFEEICPQGKLISLDRQLGHHAAVDYMYAQVKTPWVFHCEDDWLFTQSLDFSKFEQVLTQQAWMTGICFRSLSDFVLTPSDAVKVLHQTYDDLAFYRLDPLHDQWHGYTFNPHFASIHLWRNFGPFASFKKERHISRTVRKSGLVMPYLTQGGCSHLGDNLSVSRPQSSGRSRFFKWLGF